MKEQLETNGVQISYYDCDNSAGIIDFPDMKHDLARAGISIYGMYPSVKVKKDAVDLKPGTGINQPYQLCKGCGKRNFHQLRWNFRRAKEDANRYDSRRIR